MIFRALVASVLLTATGISCYANGPASTDSGAGATASTKKIAKALPPSLPQTSGESTELTQRGGMSERRAMRADGFPGMGRGPKALGLLEGSGVVLSDDQVEKLTTLQGELAKAAVPEVVHACLQSGDLKEALSGSVVDDDRIRKIFADAKTDIDSVYAKLVDHLIEVAHVFTPDQRHKLRIAFDRWSLGSLGSPTRPPAGISVPKPE